jgi:catechol 2,3-dioxygenase-like lactoylglutathione lyase family enzyme
MDSKAEPKQTDRVALAVPSADPVAEQFEAIFATEVVEDTRDDVAVARRVTLQWGHDQVELFEPVGDGPVSDFLKEGNSGLFAGGFAMEDPAGLAAHLAERNIRVHEQGADRFLVLPKDCRGTGIILSRVEERSRVGLSDGIWQITYGGASLDEMCEFYVDVLNMRELYTSRYHSDLFGYDAGVSWFDARDRAPLDSLEYLQPTGEDAAISRFVKRNGQGIYMCAIHTDDIPEIRERVEAGGPGWTHSELGGYIHPRRLGGMLLGITYFDQYNSTRPLPD